MNVLLVEDEADVASFIERGLRAEGFTITVCGDGETALHLLAAGRFDAVLLDFVLPGLDGRGVVEAMRRRGDATPVVVLTALGADDERLAPLRRLAADSLRKPFDFDELIELLRLRKINRPN